MKTLYKVLKTALWVVPALFLANCIYAAFNMPPAYSAPWYVYVLGDAIETAVIVILILTAMYFVKKKLK